MLCGVSDDKRRPETGKSVSRCKIENWRLVAFKEVVHPKIKCLLEFIHSHVVSNMYDFLSSAGHKSLFFCYVDKINRNTLQKIFLCSKR